jgi:formylglycine-generating enzyme required for sulfatase activity
MRLPIGLHAATAAAVTVMALLQGFTPAPAADPDLVAIDAAAVLYREAGEFLEGGTPVNGPLLTIRAERPIAIMRRQVTRGEYDACVADGACAALDGAGDPAFPVVGVNYDDAVAYAAWKSDVTGETWRLPTDREWALAAGSRYRDDAYTEVSDPANPARRWIAVYDAESAGKEAVDPAPRPVGSFGANEHGLLDLSGNVWEWTSTCYVRRAADPATGSVARSENCGVRIAEGRHRAYMTTFFRDPKAGACSVGIPPANLGIRLVREDTGLVDGMARWLGF